MAVEVPGQRGDAISFRRVEVGEQVGQEGAQAVVAAEQLCCDRLDGFALVEADVADFYFPIC